MNRIIYFIIALFLNIVPLWAQQPAVSIVNAESCAGREVMVSVIARQLEQIAAITLKITYNNEKLVLIGMENLCEELEGVVTNLTNNPPMIAVAWSNVNPINFENKKLFDIRFGTTATPGEVNFDGGCEIADKSFNIIAVDYQDGIVGDASPVITSQPHDVRKNSGEEAIFTLSALNAESYQWEKSSDQGNSWTELTDDVIFSGTTSGSLRIEKVQTGFNGDIFRCIAENENCISISKNALLQVDSVSGTSEKQGSSIIEFSPSYHPYKNEIALNYRILKTGDVMLTVYNLLGQVIFSKNLDRLMPGTYVERCPLTDGNSGMCFCTLTLQEHNNRYSETKKLIIID